MGVRLYEWDKTETGWAWIEITDNKVVNLILRELNNLTKINSNNEVYTDLQLDDNLLSSAVLPVGVTTGRVLQANWRPVTWTLISAKTTSGDNIKILYGDDGEIRVDNGTGTWKDITTAYFKTQAEYDALPQSKESDNNLYIIVDSHYNFRIVPWSELITWDEQDAEDYLNAYPQFLADYYEWAWDVIKTDWATQEEIPLTEWKYIYLYEWAAEGYGYYYYAITNLTTAELEELMDEDYSLPIWGEYEWGVWYYKDGK